MGAVVEGMKWQEIEEKYGYVDGRIHMNIIGMGGCVKQEQPKMA